MVEVSIITSSTLNIECQNVDMNLASQSLINTADMLQFFLSSFCIIVSAHSCIFHVILSGTSSIALLNLQMMVTRQLNPAFSESFIIKSIVTVWNGSGGVTIGLSLPYC